MLLKAIGWEKTDREKQMCQQLTEDKWLERDLLGPQDLAVFQTLKLWHDPSVKLIPKRAS